MNNKIIDCEIAEGRFINRVLVRYEDGPNDCVGKYYSDELRFLSKDFIGLTKKEAIDFIIATDTNYLRS